MKSYTYIIYAKTSPRQFNGILGPIDLYCVQLLLAGGKFLIEEVYGGDDPIGWYVNVLKDQDIHISQSKQQKYKGQNYIWLEVDTEKTPIHEFTQASEVPETDRETLAWRSTWYPCNGGTKNECLGLAVAARDVLLQTTKTPLTMFDVLDAILA